MSVAAPQRPEASERRLVLVMGAVVVVDMMFYAAIAPLLPALAHQLRLSKLSAGVMTGAFPAGTLVGSLPGGILAVRVGPKRTVYAGLLLLAGSTLAFGFLHTAALLDVARLVEGFSSACSWAGALAWIVTETHPERRGALMGNVLGAAVGGALFGPLIGTIADAVGRGVAFSGAAVLSLFLLDRTRRLPLVHTSSGQGLRYLGRALRDRRLLGKMWLVLLPAIVSGMVTVLGPLRLHAFGAGAVVIGGVYLAGAACEATMSPLVGRFADRRGRMLPVALGLVATIPLLTSFTLPAATLPLAALIVALDVALGGFWAPSMAMLSDAADDLALDQGLAAAVINLAWAAGQIIGASGGGGLAKGAGDGLPMYVTAGLCAVTLLALRARAQAWGPRAR